MQKQGNFNGEVVLALGLGPQSKSENLQRGRLRYAWVIKLQAARLSLFDLLYFGFQFVQLLVQGLYLVQHLPA